MASSSNSRSPRAQSSYMVRNFGLFEETYEGRQMICECGFKDPRWTLWRPWSIGRRFYGCPNFLNEDLKCSYFVWHDHELSIERATELLKLLINEKRSMSHEIAALKRQLRQRNVGGTVPVLAESSPFQDGASIGNQHTVGHRNGVQLEEIIENAVSNVVEDVKRKLDASIATSVHSEMKKLICAYVLTLGFGFGLVILFWLLI